MAPQPLATRSSPIGIQFGPGCLAHRPQAAALVAQIIALWTEVEFKTAMLLAAMLNASAEPTIAMYLSLANARAKREVTNAVADFIFSDEQRKLYDAVMTVKTSLESERNALAHGLFGLTIDDPLGIIVMKTSDRAKRALRFEKRLFNGELSPDEIVSGVIGTASSCLHYKLDDLSSILRDIESAYRIIGNMTAYSNQIIKDGVPSAELHQKLMAEPLVLRFLSQKPASARPVDSEDR